MKHIITEDGSHTLQSNQINDTYHSTHGAITEAKIVYIKNGLECAFNVFNSPINVLEIGFGTGLNAFLSCQHALNHQHPVVYYAIEPFPLTLDEACSLNYGSILHDKENFYRSIHEALWDVPVEINSFFTLIKLKDTLQNIDFGCSHFHLIYFDAFGPDKQPELWNEVLFKKIASKMASGGILTTYSTKGDVKRALKSVGFKLEKLAGPPGKREVLRAIL